MSLINQMLRDLEQRRTAEAGASPLGGLSASGTPTQTINFSMNYVTLAVVVAVMLGVATAYSLGAQRQLSESQVQRSTPKADEATTMVTQAVPAMPVQQGQPVIEEAPVVTPSLQQMPVVAEQPVKIAKAAVAESQPVASPVTTPQRQGDMTVEPASPIVEEAVTEDTDDANVVAESPANDDFNKTIRPLTADQQSQLAFQRAVKMLGRGKQQAAQLALEASLSFAPTHMRARETLAALLLNEGRVSEAASSLRDGLQLMAGATPLAKLYARILVDQGDIATAVGVLERARPAVSADPEYHALLAALYRQEKKYAQAARTYQQILLQRPGVASWWMGLALSQDAMGEGAPALNAFQRAQRAGGLNASVMKYVQARIEALTPSTPAPAEFSNEPDDFGE